MSNIDNVDLHYLAGLLEGEGCFTTSGKCKIVMEMTDKDIVRNAYEKSGRKGKLYGPYKRANRKDTYNWIVFRKSEVLELCYLLFPLMGKRRKIKIKEILDILSPTGVP